jgi:hypothetical protein
LLLSSKQDEKKENEKGERRKMKKIFAALATVLLLTSMYVAFIKPVKAEARSDLDVTFYASDSAAWTALLGGQADFIQWALTKEQKEAAEVNPNIQLCRVDENGYMEFDVNNNYSILSYPGVRSATNMFEVRAAIARMTDKTFIISTILLYYGVRIDVPIAAPQTTAWANSSVIGTNYQYEYNPTQAMVALAQGGFNDTDGNGWLNYPADWDGAPGADTTTYPLVVCVRSDHAHRLAAGTDLIIRLENTLAAVIWPSAQIVNENLGTGTGTKTRFVTEYSPIDVTKPFQVYVNGVLQVEGVDYDVNYKTGIVTFKPGHVPPNGSTVKATYTPIKIEVGGFKVNPTIAPRSVLSPKVMGNRDYNVYTGGWSVGRYPTYLYNMYHTDFWYPYGPNYVAGFDKDGTPMYEDVDDAVADIWYTASIATAKTAAQYFCYLHQKYCIQIPLWSYSSYWAWAKGLVGVVNEDGYGLENAYTFLNAYKVGGGPIRIATVSGPDRLNILHSQWYFEYAFLDRVYTGGMSVQPYDLAVDQPWVIQDWETGTWDDAGTEKSMVTYYIRKDVGIVEPVTGDLVRFFDAHDFEFTVWYNYAFTDSWQFGSFQDVKFTNITDVNLDGWNEFQVYFNDKSYWFYSAPTYPLLPKQELLDLLCGVATEEWDQVGVAPHTLEHNVVQVVSCFRGATQIYEGQQYNIVGGSPTYVHSIFTPEMDLTGHITITYWYADIPSTGFYLGGLPWQSIMYSLGHHYPVSMTTDPPGIGSTIVCAKNTFFFLDKPLLGEIDWAWKWAGTTKPRGGNYKIEIFDVVRATGAYCTRGDGVFNPKFFPGADIDQTDLCHIGIFDLVSITGKYGKTFGNPPAGQNIHETLTTTPQTFTNAEFVAAVQWSECGSFACTWTYNNVLGTVTVTWAGSGNAHLDIQYWKGGFLYKAHFST